MDGVSIVSKVWNGRANPAEFRGARAAEPSWSGFQSQSEQAFSTDGGKTWETNWINRYTRTKP
jgi:hypothetical protein